MNQIGQRCPHCDTWAIVRHSAELSPTVRVLYFQCKSTFCGHTWKSHLEMVCTISTSAVARPSVTLPLSPKTENLRLIAAVRNNPKQRTINFGDAHHDEPCPA